MSNIDKHAQGEKTREAFERWAEQSGALPWGILKKHRNQDGTYHGPHYTYMWHAWNACREALQDELEAKEKRTERALSLLNSANTDNVWDVIGRLKVVIGGDYRSESEIAAAAGKGEAS